MLDEVLFSSWVEKEKRTSRAGKRRYPHFDSKINFNRRISFFKSFFSIPQNVARHSFYPFIQMVIKTPRFKKTNRLDIKGKPIRKIDLKLRPISYSAHFDAFIYSLYSTLLTRNYEKKIKEWGIYDNVTAYLEKGKSNIEFANEAFQFIKSKKECVALAFDITSFFDGLDHEYLKKMWGQVINNPKLPIDHYKVFKSLTNYTFIEKEELEKEFPIIVTNREKKIPIKRICEPKEFRQRVRNKNLIRNNSFKIKVEGSSRLGKICGIPQGSPISACLSNIYMIEFDIIIKKIVEREKGLYRRYCDDIIVVVDKKDAEIIRKSILQEIRLYHLEINDSKTEVTYFEFDKKDNLRGFDNKGNYRNLQYLGFEFNGMNIYIRSSSMSRYYKRMTARIRENLKAGYGNKSIGDKIFKKKLYNRYTDKGERNFISYAKRAKESMDSETIHKQYKNSLRKVHDRFIKKKVKFEEKKGVENTKE